MDFGSSLSWRRYSRGLGSNAKTWPAGPTHSLSASVVPAEVGSHVDTYAATEIQQAEQREQLGLPGSDQE